MQKQLIFIFLTLMETGNPSITELIQVGEFNVAEELIQEQLNGPLVEQSRIELLTLYGDIWFYRSQFDAAQEQYFQALDIAKDMGDHLLQAEQMKNIAIAYSELKHYGKSLNWHQQAKNAMHHQLNSNVGMSILLSEAMIFNKIGAPELAMETLAQAQNVAFKIENIAGLNNSYLRLTSFYLKNNAYAEAHSKLVKVDISGFDDMNDLLWYYHLKLSVEIGMNQLLAAQETLIRFNQIAAGSSYQNDAHMKLLSVHLQISLGQLEAANDSIDELVSNQKLGSWQVSYLRARWFNIQNKHIQAFEHHRQAITNFIQEKIKASKTNEFIQMPIALLQDVIVNAYDIGFEDMNLLFEWMNWLYVAKHPNFSNDAKLHSNLATLQLHEKTEKGFSEVVSDVNRSQFGPSHHNKINLISLQESLKQDEGFLFYLNIKNKLYVLLVDGESVILIELHHDFKVLNDEISQFINLLSQDKAWMFLSQKIERSLVHPLRAYGLDEYKRLYIVPDENIRFLPFDVLLDEQGQMMLNKHHISFHTMHSLPQFITDRSSVEDSPEQWQSSRLSFVGTETAMTSVPNYWRTAYRNLDFKNQIYKGVKKEHDLVKSMGVSGGALLNELATETSAVNFIKNETGILHFASHGFDNPVAPAFSSLVLTQNDRDDGLLQAREVAMLRSNLSLVILASCSSAKGGLQGRYGFQLGLAEAFLQAGVKSVIGTLWDVKDQKTYQFMQWFYQIIEQVNEPLLALNLTKQKAIEAHWQVKDWSAFILLGDGADQLNLDIDSSYVHTIKRHGYSLTILFLCMMIFYFLLKKPTSIK